MRKTPDTRADLAADTRAASRVSAGPDEVLVPGLTVLCHPGLGRVGERAPLPALGSGRAVSLSRAEPLFVQPAKHPAIRSATDLGREEIEACRERCKGDLDAMAEALKVSPLGLRRRMGELGM